MKRYDATLAALLRPEAQPTLFHPGQDWPLDAVCAECSRLAYLRFERGEAERGALADAIACAGFVAPAFFSDPGTGTQAFAAVDTRHCRALIAFRGTEPGEPSDIGTNAQALLVDWQARGKVHQGFRDALASVWGPITAWLNGVSGFEVLLTGHSLGAALATLAAAVLPDAQLVNFGSPRVGNETFAAQFAGRRIRRYVYCCDLVTRVPPAFLRHAHVPGLMYIDRQGGLQPDATEAFIRGDNARARLQYLLGKGWRLGNVGLRDFADHSAVNYVYALLDNCGSPSDDSAGKA